MDEFLILFFLTSSFIVYLLPLSSTIVDLEIPRSEITEIPHSSIPRTKKNVIADLKLFVPVL